MFEHPLVNALLKLAVGGVVAVIASKLITKGMQAAELKYMRLVRRLISLAIVLIFAIWAFQDLGVDLTVLLGSAGVLTLIVSLSAKHSISNFMCGVFLMSERPFAVGDRIRLGTLDRPFSLTGRVVSIDFVSTILESSAGTLIRLPNEMVMMARIENLSVGKQTASIRFRVNPAVDLREFETRLQASARDEGLPIVGPVKLLALGVLEAAIQCELVFTCAPADLQTVENGLTRLVAAILYGGPSAGDAARYPPAPREKRTGDAGTNSSLANRRPNIPSA